MSKIKELIDHLKSHFPDGVHLVLAGEAKHELEERNREIAQLANQRDQVQGELKLQLREKSAAVDRMATEVLSLTESTQASLAKATALANQRDQVQRELDATAAQLKQAGDRVRDLGALCDTRLRYMQRTAEALTAAEKDLADLRWLVRGAREGATRQAAPLLVLSTTGPARVPPPPHVGGHSATAQAEGGGK